MFQIISFSVLLAGTWWLLSGYQLFLIVALGVMSIALVIWITYRMDAVDRETHPIHLATSSIKYFPWLILEVIKANIEVAFTIIFRPKNIDPRLLVVKASQKSEIGRVVYANSITLTPGTVTLGVEDDNLTIHALTPFAYSGLVGGEMDKRVFEMELDTGGPSANTQPALHQEDKSKVEKDLK